MAMKKRFYSVDGQMVGYEEGGVRKDFLTDHLGSIIAIMDENEVRVFDTRYSAYGRNRWITGTGCGFGWVGTYGYRETGLFKMSHYVRARHYSYVTGGWSTVDPLWPDESAYGYVGARSSAFVDPTGQIPVNCLVACGAVMAVAIDFWLVCKDWEKEGFNGFFDCTNKVWDELPDWLKQGSQIGLDACLNCLAKGIKCKIGGGKTGGTGKPGGRPGFDPCTIAKNTKDAACGLPRSCDKAKNCNEVRRMLYNGGLCLGARRAVTQICYKGVPDLKHWRVEKLVKEDIAKCAAKFKTMGCTWR